ncbi:MAG: NAD-dependent epimerase/dehydratase family protein [Deltaproteobacteria bacterium]|nr:NAD-dependent epimerase/dehydratase family protein [Deltaproteobacteria bacterium]
MKVLITGVSGALARMVADRLVKRGHQVFGVDRRPWPDAPRGVQIIQSDIRKRPVEDLFRTRRPDAMIHMATVTHLTATREERYRINLNGTRSVFEYCHQYGVKQAIFVGRHTIYGAAPDAPLYRTEAEPPLASATWPDLSDLVAADLYAGSALWRWPELSTAVLRIVYTLGPTRRGTLASFIAGPRVPTILGFDPLFHFMHENDAAEAIVVALEKDLRGVFNVAGPQPVPLSLLIKTTGRSAVPLPELIFNRALGRFGLPSLPPGAAGHIKYPIVLDGSLFRRATGFDEAYDEVAVMESFRWA